MTRNEAIMLGLVLLWGLIVGATGVVFAKKAQSERAREEAEKRRDLAAAYPPSQGARSNQQP